MKKNEPVIELHQGDLPGGVDFGACVAVDTETMGLNPGRDKLCLVQLSDGSGVCHIVQISDGNYGAPNLKALFANERVIKLFHYARFDVAVIHRYLEVVCAPVYCTKIASRLVRTYTSAHGLKDLCKDLLGVEMSKEQQSSDWGAKTLSQEQLKYAASDVLYLHRLREKLDDMLARENRADLARACFRFVAYRAELDLLGWGDQDIFSH